MEISVALAVTAILLVHVALIASCLILRARSIEHDSELRSVRKDLERLGQDVVQLYRTISRHTLAGAVAAAGRTAAVPFRAPRQAGKDGEESREDELPRAGMKTQGSPGNLVAPPADDAAVDIPAVLVGAQWKEIIERMAPILGTTPVGLLRAALDAGLTGGRPITTEMLDMLDKLVQEASDTAPPSKPRRH